MVAIHLVKHCGKIGIFSLEVFYLEIYSDYYLFLHDYLSVRFTTCYGLARPRRRGLSPWHKKRDLVFFLLAF
jgi:hypothetical protein